jgi:signal transduction histidine kinase
MTDPLSPTQSSAASTAAPLSTLEIISALSHALSHKIRTPLSVISNDLFFLQSLVPEGECARALKRCQEISSILQSMEVSEELFAAPQRIEVRAALGLFASEGPAKGQAAAEEVFACAAPALLEHLGKNLRELFALLSGATPRYSLRCADRWVVLAFSLTVASDFTEGAFVSFTHYFSSGAALDAVQPMIIDALTQYLKGTVKITSHSGMLEGEICFPGEGA